LFLLLLVLRRPAVLPPPLLLLLLTLPAPLLAQKLLLLHLPVLVLLFSRYGLHECALEVLIPVRTSASQTRRACVCMHGCVCMSERVIE
jgi:hypothetical protein